MSSPRVTPELRTLACRLEREPLAKKPGFSGSNSLYLTQHFSRRASQCQCTVRSSVNSLPSFSIQKRYGSVFPEGTLIETTFSYWENAFSIKISGNLKKFFPANRCFPFREDTFGTTQQLRKSQKHDTLHRFLLAFGQIIPRLSSESWNAAESVPNRNATMLRSHAIRPENFIGSCVCRRFLDSSRASISAIECNHTRNVSGCDLRARRPVSESLDTHVEEISDRNDGRRRRPL